MAVAAAAWAWLFLPAARQGARFWLRTVVASVAIAAYALVAQRGRLDDLFGGPVAFEAAVGVGAAGVLYGVFWAGDRFLRAFLPSVADEIGDLYGAGAGASTAVVAGSLIVAGTAEELFWRGFVQHHAGIALALAGYALVHVVARQWALVLAAAVAGAFWGGLFAWRGTLVAPIVSHVLWDLAVVVWWPLRSRPPHSAD